MMEPAKNPHVGDAGASKVVGRYTEASSTLNATTPTIIDRCVIIGQGIGNLYMVTVEPPLESQPPQVFDSHKQARGYAGGLRMCHRWQIVDQTGEAK